MDKCYEFNDGLHFIFTDFKQAIDTIDKGKLFQYIIKVFLIVTHFSLISVSASSISFILSPIFSGYSNKVPFSFNLQPNMQFLILFIAFEL